MHLEWENNNGHVCSVITHFHVFDIELAAVKLFVNETSAENTLFRSLDQMHINIQSVKFNSLLRNFLQNFCNQI